MTRNWRDAVSRLAGKSARLLSRLLVLAVLGGLGVAGWFVGSATASALMVGLQDAFRNGLAPPDALGWLPAVGGALLGGLLVAGGVAWEWKSSRFERGRKARADRGGH